MVAFDEALTSRAVIAIVSGLHGRMVTLLKPAMQLKNGKANRNPPVSGLSNEPVPAHMPQFPPDP